MEVKLHKEYKPKDAKELMTALNKPKSPSQLTCCATCLFIMRLGCNGLLN